MCCHCPTLSSNHFMLWMSSAEWPQTMGLATFPGATVYGCTVFLGHVLQCGALLELSFQSQVKLVLLTEIHIIDVLAR